MSADAYFEQAIGALRAVARGQGEAIGRAAELLVIAITGGRAVYSFGATHSFSEEDLEFLTAFSGMAAVAIENSQLIERVRREAVVLSNFQRYFAPDLARQIAGEESAVQLGGTKRRVVVFFSDIRGFTSLPRRGSPRYDRR